MYGWTIEDRYIVLEFLIRPNALGIFFSMLYDQQANRFFTSLTSSFSQPGWSKGHLNGTTTLYLFLTLFSSAFWKVANFITVHPWYCHPIYSVWLHRRFSATNNFRNIGSELFAYLYIDDVCTVRCSMIATKFLLMLNILVGDKSLLHAITCQRFFLIQRPACL